jgi:hypothetical protein
VILYFRIVPVHSFRRDEATNYYPEKQKTGTRKYSAAPVSKATHAQVKAGWDIMSVCLSVQNSSHPPPLHQINCGASLNYFYIIQFNKITDFLSQISI